MTSDTFFERQTAAPPPAMPDELDPFFQCQAKAGRWEFQVGVLKWRGHRAHIEWHTYQSWRTQPDAAQLAGARASAIKETRFFRTCASCDRIHNVGHMHEPKICQGCAERYLGVIH